MSLDTRPNLFGLGEQQNDGWGINVVRGVLDFLITLGIQHTLPPEQRDRIKGT